MPITTVIFDYGCVISLVPTPADFEPLRKAIGVEPAAFKETYWRYRDAYDLDDLDAVAYWQEFGRDVGRNFSPTQIHKLAALDCQIWGRPNPVMVEWIRLLRGKGLKTGVISNISRNVGDHLRRTGRWTGFMNHITFSGELKLLKPDPAIFHACLEGLGEPAPQALFIDDREVNVAAAQVLGMNGIVFHSVNQLRNELKPFGLAESLAEAKTRSRQSPIPKKPSTGTMR
jgi:putative hydrolase of the HAD superfamily